MTRLFMEHIEAGSGTITLGNDDSRYISKVLRMKQGEKLTVVLKDGVEALCEISKIDSDAVTLSVLERNSIVSEPPYGITLYQSVSKGERMELTIQKCVELGVTKIVPVFSERCVVRPDEPRKQNSKTERWQKIALEASRQSGRGRIPEVTAPVAFKDALVMAAKDSDIVLFPWEGEHAVSLKAALKDKELSDIKDISVFIGPEGGYSDPEADAARSSGAVTVTIGKRILRTETAGAAVLAMLLYNYEL